MAQFQFDCSALQITMPATRHTDSAAVSGWQRSGPGWFDSSWELGRGLDVHEGLPDDVGLHEWLAVCLAGPQPGLR